MFQKFSFFPTALIYLFVPIIEWFTCSEGQKVISPQSSSTWFFPSLHPFGKQAKKKNLSLKRDKETTKNS